MDPYRACPKCGKEGLEPTWHSECHNFSNKEAKPAIGKVKSKINKGGKLKKAMVNTSPEEHLHYFCKCGYDFIRLTRKED